MATAAPGVCARACVHECACVCECVCARTFVCKWVPVSRARACVCVCVWTGCAHTCVRSRVCVRACARTYTAKTYNSNTNSRGSVCASVQVCVWLGKNACDHMNACECLSERVYVCVRVCLCVSVCPSRHSWSSVSKFCLDLYVLTYWFCYLIFHTIGIFVTTRSFLSSSCRVNSHELA